MMMVDGGPGGNAVAAVRNDGKSYVRAVVRSDVVTSSSNNASSQFLFVRWNVSMQEEWKSAMHVQRLLVWQQTRLRGPASHRATTLSQWLVVDMRWKDELSKVDLFPANSPATSIYRASLKADGARSAGLAWI